MGLDISIQTALVAGGIGVTIALLGYYFNYRTILKQNEFRLDEIERQFKKEQRVQIKNKKEESLINYCSYLNMILGLYTRLVTSLHGQDDLTIEDRISQASAFQKDHTKSIDTRQGAIYDTRIVFYWESENPRYLRKSIPLHAGIIELDRTMINFFNEICDPKISSENVSKKAKKIETEIENFSDELDNFLLQGYEILNS